MGFFYWRLFMSTHTLKPALTTFGDTGVPFTFPNMIEFTVVNYCGFPVAVPKGFKWLALDTHGSLYAYKRKPRKAASDFSWSPHPKDEGDLSAHFELTDLVAYGYLKSVSKEQSNLSLIKVKTLPKYYP